MGGGEQEDLCGMALKLRPQVGGRKSTAGKGNSLAKALRWDLSVRGGSREGEENSM
jgi:hypothetical protein